MQSMRSKIFIWFIRNRQHVFKLRLKPEVVDESFSVTEFREGIDKVTAKMKLPQGVTTQKISVQHI